MKTTVPNPGGHQSHAKNIPSQEHTIQRRSACAWRILTIMRRSASDKGRRQCLRHRYEAKLIVDAGPFVAASGRSALQPSICTIDIKTMLEIPKLDVHVCRGPKQRLVLAFSPYRSNESL